MRPSNQVFSDHRDLYLEILKKAEKEADRALVQIILKKLKDTLPQPESTRDGCQVFSFPMLASTTDNSEAGDGGELFWKNGQFWQELVQFMAILAAGSSWFIYCLRLITTSIHV